MKKCCRCKEVRDESEFHRSRAKLDGLQATCKSCKRVVSLNWYKRHSEHHKATATAYSCRMKRFVYEYLALHPCVDCGESDPVVLEFDHVSGKKFMSISQMLCCGHGKASIEDEIGKCEVRCANCHRKRTAKQFSHKKLLFSSRIKENIETS